MIENNNFVKKNVMEENQKQTEKKPYVKAHGKFLEKKLEEANEVLRKTKSKIPKEFLEGNNKKDHK